MKPQPGPVCSGRTLTRPAPASHPAQAPPGGLPTTRRLEEKQQRLLGDVLRRREKRSWVGAARDPTNTMSPLQEAGGGHRGPGQHGLQGPAVAVPGSRTPTRGHVANRQPLGSGAPGGHPGPDVTRGWGDKREGSDTSWGPVLGIHAAPTPGQALPGAPRGSAAADAGQGCGSRRGGCRQSLALLAVWL